jgi:hypothetical protein
LNPTYLGQGRRESLDLVAASSIGNDGDIDVVDAFLDEGGPLRKDRAPSSEGRKEEVEGDVGGASEPRERQGVPHGADAEEGG